MTIKEELLETIEILETKKDSRNKIQAKIDLLSSQLKEEGFNSIEEAEKFLKKTEKEIEKNETDLEEKFRKLEIKYADLLNEDNQED